MKLRIRHIAYRFALILAFAAALPLAAYGSWSILSLLDTTRASVTQGNRNVATRAAEEIRRYLSANAEILRSFAATVQGTDLTPDQMDRVLKGAVIDVHEFRELTVFDSKGNTIATSQVTKPVVSIPTPGSTQSFENIELSSIKVDADELPTALLSVPLGRPDGWLVGEISLEEMWSMVDVIRIGEQGFALVVAPDGKLIAHGNPDKKSLVAQSRNMSGHPLLKDGSSNKDTYFDEAGVEQLGVSTTIPDLKWTLIVEQPTAEAYASARQLRTQLIFAISGALLVMIGVGYAFGKQFIAPIFKLQRGTQSIAEGNLQTRVEIQTEDEFGQLGDAFNTMANRLVELTENVKRQERQVMFSRIVGGLFHDLMHPIQNIGNNARLMIRPDQDDEARRTSHNIIDRELGVLKRFMDDMRQLANPEGAPKALAKVPVDVNVIVSDIVDSMRGEGESAGVKVEGHVAAEPLIIEGDRYQLMRVYRNLIKNAIQATPAGGRVTASTERAGEFAVVRVTDTGSGIPPERLNKIFDDFVTTKSRGLGLGLAISKQTVEQHGGTIAVESEVGRGTSFTLRFPTRDDVTTQAAAS